MPTLTINKTYDTGDVLTEADLDAIVSSVEAFTNVTKLDSDNIQTSGVATANIAANAVTGAKLHSNVVDNSSLQLATNTLSIKALGVGTSHLAANAVTQAKLEARATGTSAVAGGVAISTACGNFTRTSASYGDITNLSISIATTGRPVMVFLESDAAAPNGGASISSGTSNTAYLKFLRDSTDIGLVLVTDTAASTTQPLGTVILDAPASGTYTYKVQAKSDGATAITINDAKLVAFEI